MFNAEAITDPGQFSELRSEWNELLQRSRTNTIFTTWEWLHTWWKVFGERTDLFIVLVRDVEEALVGAAPLLIRKSQYYKFPVREMIFIGMGQADRQDFIIENNDYRIVHEIFSKIHENRSQWDIVNLEQVPADSVLNESALVGDSRIEKEISSFCPYVKIEGDWMGYFKSLSKKFRKDIRNKINKIERIGSWEFKVERNVSDIEQLIESMDNIETKSRKRNTEKSFFHVEANKNFLVNFCKLCMENRWLDYSTIRSNETPVAYLLGFLYNSRYYAYNTAYLEDFNEISPGKLLLNEKIRWCFEHPTVVQEFDFLRGEHYIKSLWTTAGRTHLRIVLFNDSPYSQVIRFAAFRVRPLIKRLFRKTREV